MNDPTYNANNYPVRPYAPAAYFDGEIPVCWLYTHCWNKQPSFWSNYFCEVGTLESIVKGLHPTKIATNQSKTRKTDEGIKLKYSLYEYKDAFIEIHTDKKDKQEVVILYQEQATLDEIILFIIEKGKTNKRKINLIQKKNHGYDLIEKDIILEDINLEDNYPPELTQKYERLTEIIEDDSSGLVLFSGEPGTGKSTFIKYLSSQFERQIIYLPSSMTSALTDPTFINFLVEQQSSVIIIEDAEEALLSREETKNPAVTNLLNITDGILGDCLQILVIATCNTDKSNIDQALLRKGRMLFEHEFGRLSVEQSNKLLEKTGTTDRTDKPLTLAEIYHRDDNFHEIKEKGRVGF
jgi:predicted AAA+ superfamily ATPase